MSLKKTLLFTADCQKDKDEETSRKRQREEETFEEEQDDEEEKDEEDPFLDKEEIASLDHFISSWIDYDMPVPLLKDASPCEWSFVTQVAKKNEVWKFTIVNKQTCKKETLLVVITATSPHVRFGEVHARIACGSAAMHNLQIPPQAFFKEGLIFPFSDYNHIGAERID